MVAEAAWTVLSNLFAGSLPHRSYALLGTFSERVTFFVSTWSGVVSFHFVSSTTVQGASGSANFDEALLLRGAVTPSECSIVGLDDQR